MNCVLALNHTLGMRRDIGGISLQFSDFGSSPSPGVVSSGRFSIPSASLLIAASAGTELLPAEGLVVGASVAILVVFCRSSATELSDGLLNASA